MTNEEFRLELCALVQERRPLAATWIAPTTVMSMARGIIKLGFPTTEKHCLDSLNRDGQHSFLEGLAEEILGTRMKFEMVLDPALKPPPATELHFSFDEPPKPAPKPAPKPEPRPAAAAATSSTPPPSKAPAPAAAAPSDAAPAESPEDFQNDPLIRSAIEKFKLKLASTPS